MSDFKHLKLLWILRGINPQNQRPTRDRNIRESLEVIPVTQAAFDQVFHGVLNDAMLFVNNDWNEAERHVSTLSGRRTHPEYREGQ